MSFIDDINNKITGDPMGRINRDQIKNSNRELLDAYNWSIQITKFPGAVYNPGTDLIDLRANAVTVNSEELLATNILKIEHRKFPINQPGVASKGGSVTLDFTDFEDQSITGWLTDYVSKHSNKYDSRTIPKGGLLIDLELFELNTQRKAVRKITCESGLIQSANIDFTMGSESAPKQKQTVTFVFEFMVVELLNI